MLRLQKNSFALSFGQLQMSLPYGFAPLHVDMPTFADVRHQCHPTATASLLKAETCRARRAAQLRQ